MRLHIVVRKRYTAQPVRQTVSHLSIPKRPEYNTDGSVNQGIMLILDGEVTILDAALNAHSEASPGSGVVRSGKRTFF